MFSEPIRVRFLWPVVVISLALLLACTTIAILLFRQQSRSAYVVTENITSWRAAASLEECFVDLVGLLRDHNEGVTSLHERIETLLADVRKNADNDEEKVLAQQVLETWHAYQVLWTNLPKPSQPNHESAVRAAADRLEAETIRACQNLREFNQSQIIDSTADQDRVLRELAWGLAAIGLTGATAGVLLGFVVTRRLLKSIRRLQIGVRDAAGALGRELPEIVVTQEGDLDQIHHQMRGLVGEIESIVSRLQQRDREVMRAEQLAAVGQLAAGVAHEIRNPLTSIKMLVQVGREGIDPQGLNQEDLGIIESEVRRMERLLQNLLDMARPTKPERRDIDLITVIQQTLGLIRTRAGRQNVELNFTPCLDTLRLWADEEQLQQVMVNLTQNSLDAMPSGGTLEIRLSRPVDGQIEVRIADTGEGFPSGNVPRQFEAFFSTKETGLGLGLVNSRRIIEDHGGTITATNRPKGGAEMILRLPVAGSPLRTFPNG